MAEEDAFRSYTIRRLIIGKHVAAFTIREESDEVLIVGFRHAGRLPRERELPDPDDLGDPNKGPLA